MLSLISADRLTTRPNGRVDHHFRRPDPSGRTSWVTDEIERHDVTAIVDVDRVLVAQTLVRELEIDWQAVDVILRLVSELAAARRRIAELEADGT